MVAQKKARGAKSQAPKVKAAAEQVEQKESDTIESMETAEESNGDAEIDTETAATSGVDTSAEDTSAEEKKDECSEAKPTEEMKEEEVRPGKLLVENVPASYLFEYQEKLKELFSKYGEILSVKRGPIIVTELTTTPTLSAIIEFKNKDSMEKARSASVVVEGHTLSLDEETRPETAVLVAVPFETNIEYVRQLFSQCGELAHVHEFTKTKYRILRVVYKEKEAAEKAMKLDKDIRINGFLITVTKYRDEDEQKAHTASKRRSQQNRLNATTSTTSTTTTTPTTATTTPADNRAASTRARGAPSFHSRGSYRGVTGGRGRGFGRGGGGGGGRGVGYGGYAPINTFMPPAYMPARPGFMNDGQRPNKRLRQM